MDRPCVAQRASGCLWIGAGQEVFVDPPDPAVAFVRRDLESRPIGDGSAATALPNPPRYLKGSDDRVMRKERMGHDDKFEPGLQTRKVLRLQSRQKAVGAMTGCCTFQ